MNKAIYGLKDAGKHFERHFHGILKELGYRQTHIRGVWGKLKDGKLLGLLAHFVDNCMFAGVEETADNLAEELKAKIDCSETTDVDTFV